MTPAVVTFLPCAVVPVYNHERAVDSVVRGLHEAGLTCILVDDGSSPACAAVLDRLSREFPRVHVRHRAENGGKGAAVRDGLFMAAGLGFTHALQVDADGQHALGDVPAFLEAAARESVALVCGRPLFDAAMPAARRYGRYLTHIWVWINTLSFDIPDAMCGFRVYPLVPVLEVLESARLGLRMDFDIEILVHLHWRGMPMRWLPTQVSYPADGVSHFRVLSDNLRISSAHTRLFFGMLRRLPAILARRRRLAPRVSHA